MKTKMSIRVMRSFLYSVVASLLIMGVIAFGSEAIAETFKTLRVTLHHEAKTMDPHDTSDNGRICLRVNMYDGLTRYQGNPPVVEPWLAESWKSDAKAEKWTFHLRRGVLFHDGSEMTAEDVVYSVKKILHGGKGIAGTLGKFLKSDAIKAIDKYTVAMQLTAPWVPFPAFANDIHVLNKKVLQRHEENGDYGNRWLAMTGTRLGKDGVGTGAYALKEWKPEIYWVYERFPNYFKGWDKPHIKGEVRIDVVYELSTRLLGLKSGKFDYWVSGRTYDDMQSLMQSALLQKVQFPYPKLSYIALNNQRPPTSDIHFRKALNYAFDYDTYIKEIMHGYSERSIGYIPPAMFGSLDPKKEWHYTYDLKKAREELAKCKVDYKKYEPLEIGILEGESAERSRGEMMLAGLTQLGIKANLKLVTFPTWVQEVSKPDTAYTIGAMGLSPFYIDPDHWSRLVDERGAGTYLGAAWYRNPEVYELHVKALATTNKDQRIRLYKEAQRIELKDASHIWIEQFNYHNAFSKDIGGIENFCFYGGFDEFRRIYFKSEYGK